LADAGVTRVGKLIEAKGGLPVCGSVVVEPRVVVWCTGFEPDYGWVDLPALGEDGHPRHRRGVATHVPGLYFMGLRFQHRLSSSLIGGVGDDAAYVAQHIARRCLEAAA
jgi:putative flavoprotein involved in K+ transport